MTQDLNEQFINPELQDIQEPLAGPSEASLFELDSITNTEFGKVEEDETFMQDKQANDIYQSLKPIATETKAEGYVVDDKVYTELPKDALQTIQNEKLPDPPTEEEKLKKSEELKVQKDAEIETLQQQAFERNPGNDKKSQRRRDRQIRQGTRDIEQKYKNEYETYLKDTNMSYIKDNNPTIKQVKSTDYIVQKNLKASTERWRRLLNGELWQRVSTHQGDDTVPEYEDMAQKTYQKGIKSFEGFVDAFEKDKVKDGDIFRGFTLYGYNSNTMTPFAKPMYYRATNKIDEQGNPVLNSEGKQVKIVEKVKDVDGVYDQSTGQFIPVANYKKVTPVSINYNYDLIVNFDDRVSDIETQVTEGSLTRAEADIKIKTLGDDRSKQMNNVASAYTGFMSDKKTPDWFKLVLTAATFTNDFEQKWAEIRQQSKSDDDAYQRLLEAVGGISTSLFTLLSKTAEGGEFLLKELVRTGLGKEVQKINNGVLALEVKKNPQLIPAMQQILDEAGGRKGMYLNSIEGMASLVDAAKTKLDNKDIETIYATLKDFLPEVEGVIGGFKDAKTDLEISQSLIEAGMLKINNESGYTVALKELNDGYNALENSDEKNVRDAVRYIKLKSFLMEKGSNYKDRYADLKPEDIEFLNTTGKDLMLNNPEVIESTNEQLLKLEQVAKRAKSLFPEKELKAFLSENMPDFEKKVNSYNGSLKIFNESALFSERGKFVLNRLHEIDDNYNSKFTDTNMYSFPLLSPLTQDATALNKSTPKNIIFAIKSINTIRGIMEDIRETGNKFSSFDWSGYNPNAANVSASIREYKNRIETNIEADSYAGKIVGQIAEALPQMLAFSGAFIAGGPLGGYAYLAATGTGRAMREAADAGLTGLEQIVYSQLYNGIEFGSEMITRETSLLGLRRGKSVLTKDLVKRIMSPQTRAQAFKEYARLFAKRTGRVLKSGFLEYLEEEVADKGNAILQNTFNTMTNATFSPAVFTAQQSIDMLITMIGTSAIFKAGTKAAQNMKNRNTAQEEIRKQLVKNKELNITKEEAFVISALTQKENIAPILKVIQEVESGNIKESELNLPVYEMVRDVWLPTAMSMNFSPKTTMQQRTIALDNIVKAKEISTMVENGQVSPEASAQVIETYMQNADKALNDVEYAEQQFAIEPTEMKTLIYDYFGLSDTMIGDNGILDARTEEQKQSAQAEEVDMTPIDRMSFSNRLRDLYVTNEKNSNAARVNEASIVSNPEMFLATKIQNTKDLIEKAKVDYEFALQNDMPYSNRMADVENLTQRLNDLETLKSRYLNSQQYATQISQGQQQEISQPSGIVQRQGAQEGQPQVGQAEGGIGQATQQAADISNRPISSQAQEEIATTVPTPPAQTDKEFADQVAQTREKIKNKNLFIEEYDESGNRVIDEQTGLPSQSVGELISQSDKAPLPTSVTEINGIEFVQFSNPDTKQVDVIITGKQDGSYVGFYRLYENGKPTNKWSSKMENPSKNKADFKMMIQGVQQMLPAEHEYTEKSSVSTDGLRVFAEQLNRGYELQYDQNGNLVTNLVAINGDAIVNELGIPVDKGEFENIKVKNQQEFEKVKAALLPYMSKFGLGEKDIRWLSGTVKINLPVLKKSQPKQNLATFQAQQTTDARNRNFGSQAQQAVKEITGLPDNTPVIQNYTRTINPGQEVQLMDELAQQVTEGEERAVRQMGQQVVDKVKQWMAGTNYAAPIPVIPPVILEANNRVVEARNALIDAINKSNAPANTANKRAVKTLTERLKKAFPNVKVIMDKKGFQNALKDETARDLMAKGGVVYGRLLNGEVYLNPDFANYNTPIHEFGHLWLNASKEIAPAVYNRGRELIRDSEYMAKLQADPLYEGLSTEEMENEALATAIGDRGEQFVNDVQKQGFRNWVRRLIGKLSQYVGIFNLSKVELDLLTLDEFLNRANASLLAGEAVTLNNLQSVRDITIEDTFMATQQSIKSQMIDLANAVMQRELSKGRTLEEARTIATSEVSAAVIANATGKFNNNAVQKQIENYVGEAYNERKIAEQAAARQQRISQAYTTPETQAILADANKSAQDIADANKGKKPKVTAKQAYDTVLGQVKASIDRMYASGTIPAGVSWIDMMSLAPAIASDAVRASFPAANRQRFEGEDMVNMTSSQWIKNAVSNQIRAIKDVKDRAKKIEDAVKLILKDFQNRYGRGAQLTTGQIKAIIKDLNDNIFSRDDIMTAVDKGAAEISKVVEKAYRKKVLADVQKSFDRLETASSTKYSGEYFNKVKAILGFPLSELPDSSASLEELSKLNGHIKDIVALKLESIQDAIDILNSISPSNQQRIADEHKSLLTKIKDLINNANTQTLSMLDYKKMMELKKAVEDVQERKNNISALTPQQQADIMQQYGVLMLTDLGDINRIIADKGQDIKIETTALVGKIKTELTDELSDIRNKIPNGVLYQQFLSFMTSLSDDYLSSLSPANMLSLSSALSQVYDYGNYSNMVYTEYIKALRWKQRDGGYKWGTEIAARRNEITATGLTGFVQNAFRNFARTFTDVEGATPSADAISRNLDLLKITALDYELYNEFDRLNMGYLEREIFGPMAASIDAAMVKTQSKLGQLQTAMIAFSDKSNHATIKKAIGQVLKTYDVSGSILGMSLRNKLREGRAASFLNDISVRMAAIVAHQIDHISNNPAQLIDRVLQRNIFEVKAGEKGVTFMEGTMYDYFTKGGVSFKSLEGNNNKFMDAIAYAALTNGGTTTLKELKENELMDLLTDKQKEGLAGWREHINQNRETFEAAQVIVGNMGASVKNYFPIRVYGDKTVTEVTDPMAYINGQFSNLGIDKGQTISRSGETGTIDLDANKVLLHNMKALNLMIEVMPFLQQIKGLGDAIKDVKTAKDVNEFSAAYLEGVDKNLTERLKANLSHNERVVNDDFGYTFRLMSSAQSFAARVWLISVTRQLFADFPANIGKLTSALGFENRKFGNQILQLLSPKKSRYTTDTGTYKWDDYVEIANMTGSPVYKVMSLYADNFLYEFNKTPEQLQRQQRVGAWQDMAVKKHGWMSRFEEAFKRITGEYLDHQRFKDERGVYRASNMDAVLQASSVADSFTDRQFSLPSFTRQPLRRQLLAPFLGRGIRNMFDTDKRKISLAKDNPLAILTGFLQGYPTTQHQLYNSYIKLAFSTRSGLSLGKRAEYLTRAVLEGIVPSITYSLFRSYMGVLYLSTAAAVYAAAGDDDDPKAVENKIKELDKKEGWDKYIEIIKTGLKAKSKSVLEVIINGIASTAIDPQASFFWRTALGMAAFHMYKEDATERLLTMDKRQRKKAMMQMRQKEASWFNMYNVRPIEIYGGKTYDEAIRAFYSAEEPTKGWEDLVNSFSGISAIHGLSTTVNDIRRYYAASGEDTKVDSKETAIAAGLTAYGYIFANMMIGGKFGFFLNMVSGDLRNIGTKILKEQKPEVVQEERKQEKKTRRGFTMFFEPGESRGKKGSRGSSGRGGGSGRGGSGRGGGER